MRKFFLSTLVVGLFLGLCFSCNPTKKLGGSKKAKAETFRVSFYNVENLFDTIDDPVGHDEQFLPGSEKKWDLKKYDKKLTSLTAVLDSVGGESFPDILGFCEVENRKVLEDLSKAWPGGKEAYEIFHRESPDFRGIDVALVARKNVFDAKVIDFIKYEMPPPFDTLTTREILYVHGELKGHPIHFYVNHWSSRRGGVEESEPKRMAASKALEMHLQKVMLADREAEIIIMGDFNDEPNNQSIMELCEVNLAPGRFLKLKNLSAVLKENGKGTYNYRGNWNMLDQFIVSPAIMSGTLSTPANTQSIYKEDWILYKSKNNGMTPSRTYGGPNYYGGYSDHLPIYMDLIITN